MLVLSQRENDKIHLQVAGFEDLIINTRVHNGHLRAWPWGDISMKSGDRIYVKQNTNTGSNQIKISIDAPQSVNIARSELLD